MSQRYLDFAYDDEDRLISVTDPVSRTTRFGYEVVSSEGITLSLLTAITDTRGKVWDYDYSQLPGGEYVLSHVVDPDGHTVEQTGFDQWGRAITQTFRGEALRIDYQNDPLLEKGGRRAITDGLGRVMTHTYNSQYLLVGKTDAAGQGQTFTLDEAYNRTYSEDKNGTPTYYERTPLGLTTAITNALGHTTRYEYDGRNNLSKSIDALGKETTYLYDDQNNLISTTNHLGHSTFNTYNERGQQTSVTDALGNTTYYGYDAIGQRTVITNALGHTTRYEYDMVGRLIKTIDAKGKVTVNEYDGGDNLVRVIENVHPTVATQNYQNEYNLITEYTYDDTGRRITTKDTVGRVSRSVYDEAGRLERTIQNEHPTETTQNYQNEYNLITEYVYNEAGNQIATIDTVGRETRTEYDALNRVERSIVNYVDGVYDPDHPDEDIITRFAYDDNGNLAGTFDVLGRETRTEYDELNRVERTIVNYQNGIYNPANPDEDLITRYTYDAVGNQKTITDPLGRVTTYDYDELNRVEAITNPLDGVTRYTYDAAGNRKTVTDAENHTTTYDYDALNRVITTTNPSTGSGQAGGRTVVVYDEVGNRTQTLDANGHTTTFAYDSLYRVIATTDAENQTTTVTYDAAGNRQSVTDAENHTATFTYDSLNRLLETTNPLSGTTRVTYDALGNRLIATDANNHTITYDYDDLNRPAQVTDANDLTTMTIYDGLGNRLSITNAANETTEFEYDQANRLVLTRDPLGNETRYHYDGAGSRVAMIDAEGVETRYGYDDLGRLTSVIENYVDGVYNSAVTDEDIKTEYRYDNVGNRTRVIDARGNETTYVYDDLNRRTETRDPLGNTTTYGYDAAGNRTRLTDANGDTTTFVYDNANRLLTIDYPDPEPDVNFTYDKAGNRLQMVDGTGTTSYTYDDLYRLTNVTDGAGLQVGYDYDPVGNRTLLRYPDGKEVSYTYDDGNRLDTVTDWNNGQFGYDYDAANRLAGLSLPNDVTSNYHYDEAGRLTLLTHNSITETLATYAYALDNVGNRTTLTETLTALQDVPAGAYREAEGLVVMEAENGRVFSSTTHTWLTSTAISGYTGTHYLHVLPDIDALYQTNTLAGSPKVEFAVNFTTPSTGSGQAPVTYTVWARGYAENASADSLYVSLNGQTVNVTGFAPQQWDWANTQSPTGESAVLSVTSGGLYTLTVSMREDGLRLDRLLLTTDTTYLPTDFGPTESERQTENGAEQIVVLDQTIVYRYDDLYRLTEAEYSTHSAGPSSSSGSVSGQAGELYEYAYDPVGNRLQQIIDGDTTEYLYDAANRLEQVAGSGQPAANYEFDANGNLLSTDVMTNTWDAANRLVASERVNDSASQRVEPVYDGVGNRVAQTEGATTTHFALDVGIGLPEVIQTNGGNTYLHLPGVIVAENAEGEIRYLLADGLGSIRQVVDETGVLVDYNEFDPYGNPITEYGIRNAQYGYTGEWWEDDLGLLYLRARWYLPQDGIFLSRDPVESEPPYAYVRGNPVNRAGQSEELC